MGGKTAVNHPLGKNMIGAFYQPASVVVDLDCLKTLPARELASGLAEVIKYGIILDGEFFTWLEENMDALLRLDGQAMAYCIRRCCELKAEVVAADERETGLRALLRIWGIRLVMRSKPKWVTVTGFTVKLSQPEWLWRRGPLNVWGSSGRKRQHVSSRCLNVLACR